MDVVNNSVRLFHLGANMCIPGSTTTIPDTWATNARVMELIASGDIAEAAAAGTESESKKIPVKPATPAAPAGQPVKPAERQPELVKK